MKQSRVDEALALLRILSWLEKCHRQVIDDLVICGLPERVAPHHWVAMSLWEMASGIRKDYESIRGKLTLHEEV